jgi:hypothetical protein
MILFDRPIRLALIGCGLAILAAAQQSEPQIRPSVLATPPTDAAQIATATPVDKRVFGVLPNYRTANMTAVYQPITAKEKLEIALKDSFDYPLAFLGAAYAGLYQLEDSHHQFGQGASGYFKRFGTSYTDQIVGNLLSEGAFPVLLHEDPRYFRIGEGTKWHRAGYALTRVLVTRTDVGGTRFNFSEVVGNGAATFVGWSYYSDSRNANDYFQALGTQIATDAISNVLKEFWPDIKRHYFTRRNKVAAAN